jgi:hypothetical protein
MRPSSHRPALDRACQGQRSLGLGLYRLFGTIRYPGLYFDMAGRGCGVRGPPEMALRVAKRKADVIVAFGNAAARAARRATSTVAVVMVGVADPVGDGLIRSLGRPGGNLTGLATPYQQLVAKHIELLKEIHPRWLRSAPAAAASARHSPPCSLRRTRPS